MKKSIYLFISSMFLLASCGSLMGGSTPQQVRTVKNYDWNAPTTSAAKSADVTLILVNPSFGKKFDNEKEPIFTKFIENMANDFEEMLVSKGYSLRGPFASYDEIVFRDKQDADLLMKVEVDFNYEAAQGLMKASADFGAAMLGKTAYKYNLDGDLYLGGKINIILYEPSTEEKLWVKSIPLQDKTVRLKTGKYSTQNSCFSDPGYLNPMQNVLEEYYQSTMNLGWKYLEPAELKELKVQVQAIRKKKSY